MANRYPPKTPRTSKTKTPTMVNKMERQPARFFTVFIGWVLSELSDMGAIIPQDYSLNNRRASAHTIASAMIPPTVIPSKAVGTAEPGAITARL